MVDDGVLMDVTWVNVAFLQLMDTRVCLNLHLLAVLENAFCDAPLTTN